MALTWLLLSGLWGWFRHATAGGLRVTVSVPATDPPRGWVFYDFLFLLVYGGALTGAAHLTREALG